MYKRPMCQLYIEYFFRNSIGDFESSPELHSPVSKLMASSVTVFRYVTLQRNTASHDVAIEQVTVDNLRRLFQAIISSFPMQLRRICGLAIYTKRDRVSEQQIRDVA